MEVKSNVRQRRMDRMKQIVASEQGIRSGNDKTVFHEEAYDGQRERSGHDSSQYRPVNLNGSGREDLSSARDDRMDDPEFVWKHREQERWTAMGRAEQPGWTDTPDNGGMTPPSVRQIWVKLGLSAVVFAGVWGLFQLDHPMAQRGQAWVRTALTVDYDFTAVAAWYERSFGGVPAWLPSIREKDAPEAQKASTSSLGRIYVPVTGKIVSRSGDGDLGITLRTEPLAAVIAIDTGRVVSVTSGTDKGTVVVVQHADGLQSTYAWLQSTTLQKNDWVNGGETIGSVTTDAAGGAGKLYVVVKKDNQYVNPTEVIPFD
ncbi:peptidoglycan DD-metalloendopeptidase family protein [Paenibacillus oceani]|uniref:Peptidoglycan DD-metalloendopeptidase family protein n=1 Tax=Paenibacillus oceani TaxID=2772510 RepID=A0A927GXX9_9BACL|nr:peptidoglycan DD-metalloendopeptidase family protein [Paenibacillus oceani]MBD2861005.1 peptidoglycan DD-metalloendopeptidase family protein [Paenibacillus oceani]